MKTLSVLALAGWLTSLAPAALAAPDLVILVRHAEKASEPGSDPALSAEGAQRAQALAEALKGLRVTSILTTQYRRTRDTAAPLAQALGLQPQVIETRKGDMPGHVQQVADTVRAQSGTVVVVGHSNTVTPLLAALGGPKLAELCETSFQHLFIWQPPSGWAQLSYGAPGQPPGAGCL